jgi:pimeloyl-ACP methyl ester carboxylesterase
MHDLAALIPDAEVVVVDDAAHSAYFEKPLEFNRPVLAFLARLVFGTATHTVPPGFALLE